APDNYGANNNLALLLVQLDRPAEAESVAVPFVRAAKTVGNMHLQLLNAQMAQGHAEDVRRLLEAMRGIDSTSPIYLRGQATAFAVLGEFDSAQRAWLNLGLKLRDPSYQSMAHRGQAVVAQTQGRLAEAERQARLVAGVAEQRGLPGSALEVEANIALQYVLFRRDTVSALRMLSTALQQHPLNSIPALDRPGDAVAMVYAVAGQPAEARRLLTAHEASVPEGSRRGNWSWYRATGWLALAEGRPKDAVGAFTRGRTVGDCPNCLAWDEGVAYERANMPDSAIAAYERAVGPGSGWKILSDPWGLAPSLKRLGELYEERGDKAKALDYYTRFVGLWKDADPVLQPTVREVRGRIAKLAGESVKSQ
ncbi:MAG TPA: tetratricopeptide repeat protein, partial [Gemmatimonadales bacterium]|nr:tetratricopeptide repeat protein [Gemmatimonadales bacterium]